MIRRLTKAVCSPFAILAVSLLLTALATVIAGLNARATDRARFERTALPIVDDVTARLGTFAAILHGTSGLFAASDVVERDEFTAYIKRLELTARFANLQSIGYVRRTNGASRVIYVEPLIRDNRSLLGRDLGRHPALAAAMARAVDRGMPTLSAAVRLGAAESADQPATFLMFMPLYEESGTPDRLGQRRAQVTGFTYAKFSTGMLAGAAERGARATEARPRVSVRVYDAAHASPAALLYDSRTPADRRHEASFTTTQTLDAAGRPWTLVMTSTTAFQHRAARFAVPVTAVVGLLLSLAFFVAGRAQVAARTTAERAALDSRRFLDRQRRADEALHESSRRVQLIIDALPPLVSYVDLSGRYQFVNAAYERWFDLPREQIVGRTMTEVLGERATAELSPYLDAVQAGRSVSFEATFPRAGVARTVACTYAPHLNARGEVKGFVALIADVTDERKIERWQRFLSDATRVLTSSLDYNTTLQSIARLCVPSIADCCIVYIADGTGRLCELAMAHADPLKLDAIKRLVQRYPVMVDAPYGPGKVYRTGASELVRIDEKVLNEYTPDPDYREQIRALGFRSGITVPLRVRDRLMGAILFGATDPARVYVDDDVAMAEDLSRRAAEAIENAELYASSQEAIRLRDEFLSIASHELRTPLTPLSLHLEGLERVLGREAACASENVMHRLDTAKRQTRRLTKLVESLLDVSRISTGRLPLEPEIFDLAQVAREVVERFAPEARAANCPVRLHATDPATGCWDRLRVEQILSNLLSNAIKYGAGKPIDVTINRTGDGARMTISDQGIGIAPEDSARIFDRFERAVSLRHYGGMGLGLYIVRQIVEAHGGSIAVDSAPGEGSTFSVLLPNYRAKVAAHGASASAMHDPHHGTLH